MKKALIVTALVGTLGVSGIIGYAASNASQLTTGVKSAVTAQTTTMTVDEAQKIALQKVKGSIISSEQDDDDYEFDIRDGDYVYEVEVKKIMATLQLLKRTINQHMTLRCQKNRHEKLR